MQLNDNVAKLGAAVLLIVAIVLVLIDTHIL